MNEITLATTTSVQDSGLLDQLLPTFEEQSGYIVKVLSVGSGKAATMAKQGKADVLLVHDPDSEQDLMTQGIGTNRQLIMHNDFILVGPGNDPSAIRGLDSVVQAFQRIASNDDLFISRGDSSGTDKKDKSIWKKAAIDFRTVNYYSTNSGMGETLAVASGKKGYTLCDRATFLSKKRDLELEIMVEGEQLLLNVYHAIQVNPVKSPNLNAEGAKEFVAFLLSRSAQESIGDFLKDRYQQALFVPDAGKSLEEVMHENSRQTLIH